MTIVTGAAAVYARVIRPRLPRTRARHACRLIERWFDAVDQTIEHGFDQPAVCNAEERVTRYVAANGLHEFPLDFSTGFRRRYLRDCCALELADDPRTFEAYSRTAATGTTLGMMWTQLRRAFYEFKGRYDASDPETNFADIHMRLRLLRIYFRLAPE